MATLMDKVVEILGLRIKVSVEAVDDARTAPTAVPIDEPSLHKIIRSMSGRKPDMTAHFEIIGLEAVRRRYDLHWEQIEEKVHLVVSRIIGAHMQAGDAPAGAGLRSRAREDDRSFIASMRRPRPPGPAWRARRPHAMRTVVRDR